MFVYQGVRIPLPTEPISASSQKRLNQKHIINCSNEDSACHVCEACLLRRIVRDRVVQNGKEVDILLPENNPETVKTWNAYLEKFDISEEMMFCSENSVKTLLHDSVGNLETEFKEIVSAEVNNGDPITKVADPIIENDTQASNNNLPTDKEKATEINKKNNKNTTPTKIAINTQNNRIEKPKKNTENSSTAFTVQKTPSKAKAPTKVQAAAKTSPSKVLKQPTRNVVTQEVENIACFGKIGDINWGCRRTFKTMKDLKKHWEEPNGAQCLREFISLRQSTKKT